MRINSCFARRKSATISLALLALLLLAATAHAAVPAWLRAAADLPLPPVSDETDAVILLDETVTTVKDSGEIISLYRMAWKILRPEGRHVARVNVYSDSETRLLQLQGWSIPANGKEYELKEKDALESGWFSDELYSDTRVKELTLPAAEPGTVIGYQYEQKQRPYILQDSWRFQDVHPVLRSSYSLQLPPGWEPKTTWINHPPLEPQSAGPNAWRWEIANVPALEPEDEMPAWSSLAGRMGVSFFSPQPPKGNVVASPSWRDVGLWQARLARDVRQASPEIRQKVRELTASSSRPADKLRPLAAFVQRNIRYVAIEIGIGGFQPHAAPDIFANRYGDCKDKATLLSSMLREAGIESYYVIVHTRRGMVAPSFPTPLAFNHAILAVRLPNDAGVSFPATINHPKLGPLLIFDPTAQMTPLGLLPESLQANKGLLVTDDGGELIDLPLLPPSTNRLERVAKLDLSADGTIRGEVTETRTGSAASSGRAALLGVPLSERAKIVERFLGEYLANSRLQNASVANLESFDDGLILKYSFVAENYAKNASNLLLLRPRVLGQKSEIIEEKKNKERKFPVEFPAAAIHRDIFEITLPPGYVVDELPRPLQVTGPAGSYHSKAEVQGNVLRYEREYRINEIMVPTEKLPELKKFFRQVAADERNAAVLRRAGP